jgi:hypothetical protein
MFAGRRAIFPDTVETELKQREKLRSALGRGG